MVQANCINKIIKWEGASGIITI